MTRHLTPLAALIGLALLAPPARAAGDPTPAPPPWALLMYDGRRVVRLDLARPQDKPLPVIDQAGWFRALPSGHFILADKYYHLNPDARWYVGHVGDPKALKEVPCVLRESERLKDAALSNDATRVLWATHRPKRDGRLLVTRVADGSTTPVLERPALGHFRTFGPPAWSPDDKQVAVIHLRSPGIRPDLERSADLIAVDVSGDAPKDRLLFPEPFVCNDNETAVPIWSPDARRLIVQRAPAAFEQGGQDEVHMVGDGPKMRLAYDTVFLDDHRHVATELKYAAVPGGDWITVTGQRLDTKTGKTTPLKFESPVDAALRMWSPDGRFTLIGLYQRGQPADTAVRLTLIDTASGEKRPLIVTGTAIGQSRHLTFVPAAAAR